jgi:hypothetical protein
VALASVVHEAADHHWVQTPYRYFPVEPHWLFPGLQFLPLSARARVAQHWPLVHTRPANACEALDSVMGTELVSLTEMKSYFPDSRIVFERLCGLPKSMTAVR